MPNGLAVEAELKKRIADFQMREAEWLRLAVALAERRAPKREVDAAYTKSLAAVAVKNDLIWQLARLTGRSAHRT